MTTQKALPNDLIDSLISNYKKPEDLISENWLLKQLTKALVERALQAEMTEHLGYNKYEPVTGAAAFFCLSFLVFSWLMRVLSATLND